MRNDLTADPGDDKYLFEKHDTSVYNLVEIFTDKYTVGSTGCTYTNIEEGIGEKTGTGLSRTLTLKTGAIIKKGNNIVNMNVVKTTFIVGSTTELSVNKFTTEDSAVFTIGSTAIVKLEISSVTFKLISGQKVVGTSGSVEEITQPIFKISNSKGVLKLMSVNITTGTISSDGVTFV